MPRYIIWRLLQVLPILLLVSMAMFAAMHAIPGGPTSVYGRGGISSEALDAIRARLGLDDPLPLQYIRWLAAAVQGDLGYSSSTGQAVTVEIGARLGPTLLLMGASFLVVLAVSIPLGIFQALRQYSRADIGLTTLAFVGASMPVYWLALLLIMLDAAIINPVTNRPFLPIGGMTTPGKGDVGDVALHMVLPMICLVVGWIAWYSRYIRSSMLDVLGQDYIRASRAKGLSESKVIFKHALKNASLPLLTVMALDLPYLFAGALYTEIIFGWPGMGQLFFRSVTVRDYPLMLGMVLIIAVAVVVGNLLADVAYGYLDPRIQYDRR